MSQALELYIMPGCPFCRKVLSYMERRGIEIPLRDITADPSDRSTFKTWVERSKSPACLSTGSLFTNLTTSSHTSKLTHSNANA